MSTNKSLVSVIIPIYNVEKYLDKCLSSIISQTYRNLEIILIDDGSTDNSGKICDQYKNKDSRIKVIHRKNGGLSAARNTGISHATGTYLTFIDSDDYVAKNFIQTLVSLSHKYNSKLVAVKQYVVYPEHIINTGSNRFYSIPSKEALEKMLYGEDFDVSAWAKLYHAELFKSIRYPEGQIFEDSATTYKLIDSCDKVVLKSIPLYYYIIRPNSITNRAFSPKKLDLIKSTKAMTDYLSNKYPDLRPACDRRLMYAYLSTLSQLAKVKKTPKKYLSQLMPYIKKNRASVLSNPRAPQRDRIALHLTKFGFKPFKIFWNIYSLLTKRK